MHKPIGRGFGEPGKGLDLPPAELLQELSQTGPQGEDEMNLHMVYNIDTEDGERRANRNSQKDGLQIVDWSYSYLNLEMNSRYSFKLKSKY